MVKVSVNYTGDLHCDATHGPSQSKISTDAPTDNKGKGEAFSPTDLVATALATCMSTTVGINALANRCGSAAKFPDGSVRATRNLAFGEIFPSSSEKPIHPCASKRYPGYNHSM